MKKLLLSFGLFLGATLSWAQGPGCPNVNAGPDQTLPCNTTCTTLNATMFQTGATTSYTVSSIPYNPPGPSSAWVNSFVNTDDIWSGVINLPFTFCFYGANYTQLVIGANGIISFNTAYANQFCPWSYSASIPSAALPVNAIFGAYHDIDPSVCGSIRYAISGTFPCRTFMFDFDQVCHYNCNNQRTTQRIVLYETSNVIEVYIGNKPVCAGWNGGRAVIGIQNIAGDVGVTPLTRQTGAWNAANEAWRFTPSGAPNYQINWYSSEVPGVIGTTPSINVCPINQFATYSALLTYTNCNNAQVVVSDEVSVTLTGPARPRIYTNAPICAGSTLNLNTDARAGATYVWTGPGGWTSNAQTPIRPGATTAMSGTYTLYVVVAGCTSATATQTVTILNNSVQPAFTTNSPICAGTTLMLDGPTYPGGSYFWSGPGGWTSNVEDPTRGNVTAAMSGVYSLYVVVAGCTSATATQNVVINAAPAAPVISSNSPICTPNTINLFGPTIAGATYGWTGPGGWNSNLEDPSRPNSNVNMSGNYSLYVVVAGCTSQASNTNVVVNGPPIPTINIPQQICAGQTAVFASGTYPGATYVWSGPNGFTASVENPTIPNITVAATGNYSLYLVQAGCTSLTLTSYMEVVNTSAPLVASNSPVCVGGTINLTSNTISGATYVWSGPNGFTSSLEDPSITGATAAMSGTYSLYTVVNGCTSATATVNVTVNPVPTVNAVTNQTICNGNNSSNIAFSGTVAGTTFAWTNSNPSIGLPASGNGDIAPFAATNTGSAPVTATITVTPTAAGCPGTPITFTITVNPTPTVNAISNQSLCNGATTAAVNFGSPVTGTTYAWTNSDPSIGLPANGNGNIAAFTATNTGTAPVTATITVTPTANACVGTPRTFTITVNPIPSVNAVTGQTLCNGATTTAVTFAGPVTGTTYAWTNSDPTIGMPANGNGNIGTFTATNTGTAPVTATITVTPTAGGCPGTPHTFTYTVNPTPTVNAVANQTLCNGAASTAITFGSPVTGTTYAWTNSDPSIGLAANGNGNIGSFTATNTGNTPVTATVTVTPTANGCPGTPRTFTITVNPTPTVNAVTPQTLCNGAATTAINFGGNVTGTTYAWTNSDPSIGLAANGNGDIASFTATNTGTAPVTATITVTPGANACTGTPITFTITVNPTPNVNAVTAQTVCNGANTTAINFGGATTGTTYAWTNSDPSIGLAANGNGDIASFTATNTGNTPVTATITATPTATGCAGTPVTFTITVNPTPTVNAVTPQTLCNGANTNTINFTGNVTGTTYAWTNSDPSIGLAANGNGDIALFAATNTGNTPVTATVTVTPSANGCTGTPATFTITVNPTPTVNAVNNQTVCAGTPVNGISFAGNVTNATYAWTNSDPSIGLAANGNGYIAGFTGTNTGNTPVTATVTVTPSANGCTGTPVTFTITVNPTPSITPIGDQTLCAGATTANIPISGPITGATYAWTNDAPSIGLAANGNGDIAPFTVTNTGNTPVIATVTATPTANACTGPTEVFTITVNPIPTVNAVGNQTVCHNAAVNGISFAGNVTNATYAWTNSDPSIGLAANGNGDIAGFTGTNTGNTPVTATVTVTPSANGCTGTPVTFTITVNPTPSITPISDQTLCAGATTANIPISGPITGATYAWTNDAPSIGLAANGNGDIAPFTVTNTGNTPVIATVTATPTANACTGPAEVFTITVNPIPTVNAVGNQTVCHNAAVNGISFAGNVTNATYAWTNSDPSIGLAANGNGDIAGFTGTNTGNTAVTATVTVTPSANGCTGTPVTFTITVNPTPSITPIGDQTLCNRAATAQVTIAGPVTGATYAWTNTDPSIGLAANGNGDIASFTATNSGNTPVTATITATPTAAACTGAAETFTITVKPTPTVGSVNNQALCNGTASNPINFAGTVAATTFAWTNTTTSIGLGASGNGDIAPFTGTNTGTAPVTATVTVTPTADGCTGTAGTFTVSVNPTQTGAPVTATICAGSTYNFGGQTFSTAGTYPVRLQNIYGCDSTVTLNLLVNPTYTGTLNRNICSGTNFSFGGNTYSTTGAYPVTFQTIRGCDSTVTLNLTVDPTPVVAITPQPAQCLDGNSFNFSTTQNQPAGSVYNWVFVNANIPGSTVAAPQNVSYATAGTFPVGLTVTRNGCQDGDTILVTVHPNPNVQFNAQPPTGCVPLSVTFTDITTPAGGALTWDFGPGHPASNTSPVTVTYLTPGVYGVTLSVTDVNGCSGTRTAPGLVNAQAPPVAGFGIQPSEINMGNPTAYFADASTGANSVYYYVPGVSNSAIPGPNAQYQFPKEGTYEVMQIVYSSGGCADTAFGQLIVEGVTEVFIPNAFTPNDDPFNPGFRVVGNGFSDFHMMIFDRWGELLFETRDHNEKWNGTFRNKVLPQDVYVYKVELTDFKKNPKTYIGSVTLVR